MLALARRAGNASTLALMRRARGRAEETPVTLTLPGVVDGSAVSSWSLDNDARGGRTTGLHITRPTDADSPVLARALTDGAPGVTARLVVRKLTPLGWVRQLTLTMQDCMVSSYQPRGDYESVGLTFTGLQVEQ
jgi:type VI protein secretion system component Hcp